MKRYAAEKHTVLRAQLAAEATSAKETSVTSLREEMCLRCTGPGSLEYRGSFSFDCMCAGAPPFNKANDCSQKISHSRK